MISTWIGNERLKACCLYTREFAQGMNIPKVNPPSTGPPTMPKIPNAA